MEAWVAARVPKPVSPSWNPNLGIVLRIVLFQVRVQVPRIQRAECGPPPPNSTTPDLPTHLSLAWIERSSTSKISTALAPIVGLGPRAPYAISAGTKSCHLDPTGMSWRASVQPLMTLSTGKVAGWPRLYELSNSVPSMSVPL